ncbi:unnamed protein product [Ilex paraguariensis]|uniref:Uncharacterized protein n=1 Tax=Ilex paraguariensis TaxID=185542 RepID=A0ABC8QT39_9AQUA
MTGRSSEWPSAKRAVPGINLSPLFSPSTAFSFLSSLSPHRPWLLFDPPTIVFEVAGDEFIAQLGMDGVEETLVEVIIIDE